MAARARVPKLCGADIELANFIRGIEREAGTGAEASVALLREIDGVSAAPRWYGWSGGGPYGAAARTSHDGGEIGRKFLPSNGSAVYVDLWHLEVCLPEVLSAFDHVACWQVMLRIVEAARVRASAKRRVDEPIEVLASTSDGLGQSFGSHLDFLVTREAWDGLFQRKPHHLAWLAALQVSSIVVTGQGKVGSENGRPPVAYQLSQRADFIETLTGIQTTYARPLLNTRDEPLCGSVSSARRRDGLARLHVISFDSTLCQVASLLKVGILQIALAMLEAGRVDPGLALDDPLAALGVWGHDPSLCARASLATGGMVTAVELQMRFAESARRFVDDGECDGFVARADEIVTLWQDTLDALLRRDWPALARRLDWVLKRSLIDAWLAERAIGWDAPEAKALDHLYASTDGTRGLHAAMATAGLVEEVVGTDEVDRFMREPPADTRAWGRAMLLRAAGDTIDLVDWDRIRMLAPGHGGVRRLRTIDMADPLGWTREAFGAAATQSRSWRAS